jgi:hypothetical protein
MLDDLRSSATYQDEEPEEQNNSRAGSARRSDSRFLGMTAPQRFVIVLMLFMMMCIFGSFALIVTGSVSFF